MAVTVMFKRTKMPRWTADEINSAFAKARKSIDDADKALSKAVASCDLKAIDELLAKFKRLPCVATVLIQAIKDKKWVVVDVFEKNNFIHIIESAVQNDIDAVRALLDYNYNVNAKDHELGSTALMIAAEINSCALAELLLLHGANVDEQDKCGQTPLMKASINNHKDMVELLLSNGADPEIKDNSGLKAGDIAIKQGHDSLMEFIVDFKENQRLNDLISNNSNLSYLEF